MSPAFPKAAVLTPTFGTGTWLPAEPVTSPIPVVEPTTSPITTVGVGTGSPAAADPRHGRQAAVLSGVVGLVMLAALLLALGVL